MVLSEAEKNEKARAFSFCVVALMRSDLEMLASDLPEPGATAPKKARVLYQEAFDRFLSENPPAFINKKSFSPADEAEGLSHYSILHDVIETFENMYLGEMSQEQLKHALSVIATIISIPTINIYDSSIAVYLGAIGCPELVGVFINNTDKYPSGDSRRLNVNVEKDGRTALKEAVMRNSSALMESFFCGDTIVHDPSRVDQALMVAIHELKEVSVKMLLGNYAKLSVDHNGNNALGVVFSNNFRKTEQDPLVIDRKSRKINDIVTHIMNAGISIESVDAANKNGDSALSLAVMNDHQSALSLVLKRKLASPKHILSALDFSLALDNQGCTDLLMAALSKMNFATDALIVEGLKLGIIRGFVPLMHVFLGVEGVSLHISASSKAMGDIITEFVERKIPRSGAELDVALSKTIDAMSRRSFKVSKNSTDDRNIDYFIDNDFFMTAISMLEKSDETGGNSLKSIDEKTRKLLDRCVEKKAPSRFISRVMRVRHEFGIGDLSERDSIEILLYAIDRADVELLKNMHRYVRQYIPKVFVFILSSRNDVFGPDTEFKKYFEGVFEPENPGADALSKAGRSVEFRNVFIQLSPEDKYFILRRAVSSENTWAVHLILSIESRMQCHDIFIDALRDYKKEIIGCFLSFYGKDLNFVKPALASAITHEDEDLVKTVLEGYTQGKSYDQKERLYTELSNSPIDEAGNNVFMKLMERNDYHHPFRSALRINYTMTFNIEFCRADGMTPLMLAIVLGRESYFDFILRTMQSKGLTNILYLKNNQKKDAFDFAIEYQREHMLRDMEKIQEADDIKSNPLFQASVDCSGFDDKDLSELVWANVDLINKQMGGSLNTPMMIAVKNMNGRMISAMFLAMSSFAKDHIDINFAFPTNRYGENVPYMLARHNDPEFFNFFIQEAFALYFAERPKNPLDRLKEDAVYIYFIRSVMDSFKQIKLKDAFHDKESSMRDSYSATEFMNKFIPAMFRDDAYNQILLSHEKKIRRMLLEKILEEAKDVLQKRHPGGGTSPISSKDSKMIVDFMTTKRMDAIADGDEAAMEECGAVFVSTLSRPQTAFRNYNSFSSYNSETHKKLLTPSDNNMPYRRVSAMAYDSMKTLQDEVYFKKSILQQFSIDKNGATVSSEENIRTEEALNLDLRRAVESKETCESLYIYWLSEICRGNNQPGDAENGILDNPSCTPGFYGRFREFFKSHPLEKYQYQEKDILGYIRQNILNDFYIKFDAVLNENKKTNAASELDASRGDRYIRKAESIDRFHTAALALLENDALYHVDGEVVLMNSSGDSLLDEDYFSEFSDVLRKRDALVDPFVDAVGDISKIEELVKSNGMMPTPSADRLQLKFFIYLNLLYTRRAFIQKEDAGDFSEHVVSLRENAFMHYVRNDNLEEVRAFVEKGGVDSALVKAAIVAIDNVSVELFRIIMAGIPSISRRNLDEIDFALKSRMRDCPSATECTKMHRIINEKYRKIEEQEIIDKNILRLTAEFSKECKLGRSDGSSSNFFKKLRTIIRQDRSGKIYESFDFQRAIAEILDGQLKSEVEDFVEKEKRAMQENDSLFSSLRNGAAPLKSNMIFNRLLRNKNFDFAYFFERHGEKIEPSVVKAMQDAIGVCSVNTAEFSRIAVRVAPAITSAAAQAQENQAAQSGASSRDVKFN